MKGIILTNYENDFLRFRNTVRKYQFDTVKVVTAWGTGKAWDQLTRAQILALTPYTIVRTVTGDPSYKENWKKDREYVYPDSKRAIAEIQPWYAIKPDILIEIGNEPNLPTVDVWTWRYYLRETLITLRKAFPLAKFISGGLIQNEYEFEWYTILGEKEIPVLSTFDYIGVHLYEHEQFYINSYDTTEKTTASLVRARKYGIPFITEMGINKSLMPRYTEYTRLLSFTHGVIYHYNTARDIDPQYHME